MKRSGNFKQTKIGRIPLDWGILKIVNLFDVETGATPSTRKKEYWNKGSITWITPTDLSKLRNSIYIQNSERKITENAQKEESMTLLPKNSIIISTRAPVGYIAVLLDKATFNQGCKGLIIRDFRTTNSEFCCYYLQRKKYNLEMLGAGSTFKELSKERIENFLIPLPPLHEQQKIAEILGTVDEAIEKVDKVIEKTQRLKKGLMQQLLTKGIGHKEFKDSKFGKISEKWDVVSLGEMGTLQYGFTASAKKEDTGIRFLRITDIKEDGLINWTGIPYCEISESDFKKYKLNEGDILFARIGATTGKTAFIDRHVKGVFASYLIRFVSSKDVLETKFLYFYTQSPFYWNRVNREKEGQLKKGMNATMLSKLNFPFPSLFEQKKIVEILSSVDRKLELLRERKKKFERIKKGLMNDLLTGKKRVRV